MPNYQIITDSACDLPAELLQNLNVKKVSLSMLFRGENRPDSVDTGIKEFYDGLRAGDVATTSAVNPESWKSVIEPAFQAGHDALVLAFSSGLSTTYQSAVIAADELAEKYPQQKVLVVDTLGASLGQGLLLWYACKQRDEGMELEALADWVQEYRFKLAHWFTVDDLMYLKRGGRVSAVTAVVGTMLSIKPEIAVRNGTMANRSKFRGSMVACAKKYVDSLMVNRDQIDPRRAFVTYTVDTDPEIVAAVYDAAAATGLFDEILQSNAGSVITSHCGKNTIGLLFLDKLPE